MKNVHVKLVKLCHLGLPAKRVNKIKILRIVLNDFFYPKATSALHAMIYKPDLYQLSLFSKENHSPFSSWKTRIYRDNYDFG